MTHLNAPPAIPTPADPELLFREARQRRRRRWLVAGIVVVAFVLVGATAGFVASSGGSGPNVAVGNTTSQMPVTALAGPTSSNQECPGTIHVGPATLPDILPSATSHSDSLQYVRTLASNDSGLIHRLYEGVTSIRAGSGGGYVWTRTATGNVVVIHIKNYDLYINLADRVDCPTSGRLWGSVDGIGLTFLAPGS